MLTQDHHICEAGREASQLSLKVLAHRCRTAERVHEARAEATQLRQAALDGLHCC